MLRPLSSVLEPDPRWIGTVILDEATNAARPVQIEDVYRLVQPLELATTVPEEVRSQFDTVRTVFLYSWLSYDLVTVAEQQGYAVLEMGLRERFRTDGGKAPSKRDLKGLLGIALQRGWLRREDYEVPSPYVPGRTICLLDQIGRLRNRLAHGHTHLFPVGSLEMIRLCAELLERLFPSAQSAPD